MNTDETYKLNNGYKTALPIYYRNKIYSEKEREKLWIQKLNKEERWLKGVKFDVSTEEGQLIYEKALELQARKEKEILGHEAKLKFKSDRKIYKAYLKEISNETKKRKQETRKK